QTVLLYSQSPCPQKSRGISIFSYLYILTAERAPGKRTLARAVLYCPPGRAGSYWSFGSSLRWSAAGCSCGAAASPNTWSGRRDSSVGGAGLGPNKLSSVGLVADSLGSSGGKRLAAVGADSAGGVASAGGSASLASRASSSTRSAASSA